MGLIDVDKLKSEMYHNAFEIDTDLQKWDSGCWIRYKMFENVIEKLPTVDAVPVVRCKDCKWWKLSEYNTFGIHICQRFSGVRGEHDFCSRGERKEDE